MNISSIFRGCFISKGIKHLLLVTFVICFSVAFNLQAQAQIEPIECIFLDDFSNATELSFPPVELDSDDNPGPINILDDGSPGVLGSFRNITFGPVMNSRARILIRGGEFSFATGPGIAPISILYNANGAGLDADLSNTTAIQIQFMSNDVSGTSANMIITDAFNNTANLFISNLPNSNDDDEFPLSSDFPLSAFNGINSLDLSNIQSIGLEINPTRRGADFLISSIDLCRPLTRDVPTLSEWGLIVMAGILGIVSFMVMRRRQAAA